MKRIWFSTFNWEHRGRRGWIIGPFFGRQLTILWDRRSALNVDSRDFRITDNRGTL